MFLETALPFESTEPSSPWRKKLPLNFQSIIPKSLVFLSGSKACDQEIPSFPEHLAQSLAPY